MSSKTIEPAYDWHDFVNKYYGGCLFRIESDICTLVVNDQVSQTTLVFRKLAETGHTAHKVTLPYKNILDWKYLKPPRLGWIAPSDNSLPVYVSRNATRQTTKGIKPDTLHIKIPNTLFEFLTSVTFPKSFRKFQGLDELLESSGKDLVNLNLKSSRSVLEPSIRLSNLSTNQLPYRYCKELFFREFDVPLEEAMSNVLSGNSMAKTVNNKLLIYANTEEDYKEYPALVAGGPFLIGKINKNKTYVQIGNLDMSDFLLVEE